MIRYRRRYWAVAACLSAIAGFVDATAFVHLGGFFVSFMSGNSTRLGVGLAETATHAALAGGLIAAFVCGVVLGSFANRSANKSGGVRVTLLVAAVLALAATFAGIGANAAAITCLALAMGAANAVFQRDGEVSIGVTYMTGTLVKAGQRIAAALTGGARFAWAPYLLLWGGLVLGAYLGAISYAKFGLNGVWFPTGAALILGLAYAHMPEPD
ncbi:MAG: YoaK family protein [Hyphomonadaceae bacterium]